MAIVIHIRGFACMEVLRGLAKSLLRILNVKMLIYMLHLIWNVQPRLEEALRCKVKYKGKYWTENRDP